MNFIEVFVNKFGGDLQDEINGGREPQPVYHNDMIQIGSLVHRYTSQIKDNSGKVPLTADSGILMQHLKKDISEFSERIRYSSWYSVFSEYHQKGKDVARNVRNQLHSFMSSLSEEIRVYEEEVTGDDKKVYFSFLAKDAEKQFSRKNRDKDLEELCKESGYYVRVQEIGELWKSAGNIQRARHLYGLNPQMYREAASLWKKDDPLKSRELLKKAFDIASGYTRCTSEIKGDILLEMGEYERALKYFKDAAKTYYHDRSYDLHGDERYEASWGDDLYKGIIPKLEAKIKKKTQRAEKRKEKARQSEVTTLKKRIVILEERLKKNEKYEAQ